MRFDSFQEVFQQVRQNPKLIIADDYELTFQRIERYFTKFSGGEEALSRKEEKYWVSLRILHRKRFGRAVINHVSKESLSWLIENAFLSAESAGVDPWFKFPLWKIERPEDNPVPLDFSEATTLFGMCDPETEFLEEKYDVAGFETTIHRKSEKKNLHWFGAQYGVQLGLLTKGAQGRFWVRENRQTNHAPKDRAVWLAEMRNYATALKDASVAKVGKGEKIVMGPAVSSRVLREISPGFSREMILQDKSSWEGKREAKVFSTAVSLIDDGGHPAGAFSAPFDMEGTPAQKTVLVDRGYLKTYLYDTYHATQENRLSTGNFVRGAEGDSPQIGPTNLFIEPTSATRTELEAGIDNGFSLQSIDEIDSTSQKPDERILYCSGWRVESGKRTRPVRQVEVHIDLRHVLESAAQVADDLTFYGSYGSPSILFENIL